MTEVTIAGVTFRPVQGYTLKEIELSIDLYRIAREYPGSDVETAVWLHVAFWQLAPRRRRVWL